MPIALLEAVIDAFVQVQQHVLAHTLIQGEHHIAVAVLSSSMYSWVPYIRKSLPIGGSDFSTKMAAGCLRSYGGTFFAKLRGRFVVNAFKNRAEIGCGAEAKP